MLTITKPDNWHTHLRWDPKILQVFADTRRAYKRVLAMPNTTPPISNLETYLQYRRFLDQHKEDLEIFVALYLTDHTTKNDITELNKEGVFAAKLYPAGATTNSSHGLTQYTSSSFYALLDRMQDYGMNLCIHAELPDTYFLHAELRFLDIIHQYTQKFPHLKITIEHVSSKEGVDFVKQHYPQVVATVTPMHLMQTTNDILYGRMENRGLSPHNFCYPVPKTPQDRTAIQEAVFSGHPGFFAGDDSAPHTRSKKESSCGCAGCYVAPVSLETYVELFEKALCLDKLEGFLSEFGANHYGLMKNTQQITLIKEEHTVPLPSPGTPESSSLVSWRSQEKLLWKIKECL